jgi:hypothetical protein
VNVPRAAALPSPVRAFWEGVSRPSLIAAFGAIVLGLGQIALVATSLTTERVARLPSGFLMEDSYDYYGYVTQQALQMASTNGAGPTVVLLGTSASRHAIADHEAFERQLTEALGQPVDFRVLSTGSQTLWEAAAVAEYLPQDLAGVVLVEVSPWRLGAGPEELRELVERPRLGLDSRIVRAEAAAAGLHVPEPTGNYLVDHGRFLVPRLWTLVRNLVAGSPEYVEHGRHLEDVLDERRMKRTLWITEERMQVFTERGAQAAPVLRELVAELRRRPGLRVALVETVVHPRLKEVYGDRLPAYQARSAALAKELGVFHWQPGVAAALGSDDFRDWTHLYKREAQERYEDALAAELVPVLEEVVSEAGS